MKKKKLKAKYDGLAKNSDPCFLKFFFADLHIKLQLDDKSYIFLFLINRGFINQLNLYF